MRRFEVNDKCNGCGICALLTDYLVEDKRGFAVAVDGKIVDDDYLQEAGDVVAQCPVGALSLVEIKNGVDENTTLDELVEILKNRLNEVGKAKIDKEKIKFFVDFLSDVPMWVDVDDEKYFSSAQKARDYAGKLFYKEIYSRAKEFILGAFMDYKHYTLEYYYRFGKESFYSCHNKEYEKLLNEIQEQARVVSKGKIKLPHDFVNFNVYPDVQNDSVVSYYQYRLENFEEHRNDSGIITKLKEKHSLDSYINEIEVEDDEFTSSRKKWYPSPGLVNITEKFENDLTQAVNSQHKTVEAYAKEDIKHLLESYNDEIKKMIKKKLKVFEEAVVSAMS